MNLRLRPRAGAFLALLLAVGAGLLAAPAAAAADDPTEVAVAYLKARAAAVTSRRPAAILAPHVVAGSALAARETFVARGTALRQADLGHVIDDVTCTVTVTAGPTSTAGDTAVVIAHAVTRVEWHARGGPSLEASGVDHTLTLKRIDGVWRVAADASGDVELPALLERADAPVVRVRAAERRLEAAAAAVRRELMPLTATSVGGTAPCFPSGAAVLPTVKRYAYRLVYDREAVQAYADRYALAYNPTYARFTGDCCNFVSQSALAGSMPMALGDWTSGWWYDKEGTSSSSDDHYSWSWISCSRQIAFWVGTRIDWVSSIGSVGKGDFIYYDWTGDGSWDHVAVLVGTNSAGQKVIDAHTTDHYHYYWKLGSSSTRYKYGRVRPVWVV